MYTLHTSLGVHYSLYPSVDFRHFFNLIFLSQQWSNLLGSLSWLPSLSVWKNTTTKSGESNWHEVNCVVRSKSNCFPETAFWRHRYVWKMMFMSGFLSVSSFFLLVQLISYPTMGILNSIVLKLRFRCELRLFWLAHFYRWGFFLNIIVSTHFHINVLSRLEDQTVALVETTALCLCCFVRGLEACCK